MHHVINLDYGLAKMQGLLVAYLSATFLVSVHATFMDGLSEYLGLGRPRTVLDSSTLAKEYKSIDEPLLRRAYQSIDQQLERLVQSDNLHKNIRAVHNLLRCEMEAISTMPNADRKKAPAPLRGRKRKQCSIWAWSSAALLSKDVMINALMRLYQLDHINHPDYTCTILATKKLEENNRLARDPIGRRNRSPDSHRASLSRVDKMVFDAALHRAQACIPNYKNTLRKLWGSSDQPVALVSCYWDTIFTHRVRKAYPDERRGIGFIFYNDLGKAMRFVMNLANAVEPDDIGVALHLFDQLSDGAYDSKFDDVVDLRIFQFEVYVETPCSDYVVLYGDIFQSLDFDMKLKDHIQPDVIKSIVSDVKVNEQRAYYRMCRKLLEQRDEYVRLIAQSLHR